MNKFSTLLQPTSQKLTLTKASLAHHLEEKIGIDSMLALSIVENFFEEIKHSLKNNEPVKLVGLGQFSVSQKNARPGRNPKTGKPVSITPRQVIKFKTSPTLRKILNQLSLPSFGA